MRPFENFIFYLESDVWAVTGLNCSYFLFQRFKFHRWKRRLASAFLLSQHPAPNFSKSVNHNSAYVRVRSQQRHAPLSPARRRLRPRGPRSSPRDRPHAGPGARAAALLAAGPGAMPPDGRATRAAAHGRVPARPG